MLASFSLNVQSIVLKGRASMSGFLNRRRVLAGGAAALGAAVLGPARSAQAAVTAPPGVGKGVPEESRTLDEPYREASAHGGKLVVYSGGDRAASADAVRAAFGAAFPAIELTMIVDYSKFHDVRIDNQFATGTLVPDVVLLQPLQNFPRWAGSCGTSRPDSRRSTTLSRIPAVRGRHRSSWVQLHVRRRHGWIGDAPIAR